MSMSAERLDRAHTVGNPVDDEGNGDTYAVDAGVPPMIWRSNVIRSSMFFISPHALALLELVIWTSPRAAGGIEGIGSSYLRILRQHQAATQLQYLLRTL
jgi:hypothetical protein